MPIALIAGLLVLTAGMASGVHAQDIPSAPDRRPGQNAPAPPAEADPGAVPTRVVVHVVAHDAKLLQDPVGGAQITIRNAETDEVLARGKQTGGSGSTKQIMQRPERRGETIYNTPGAARYAATLPLSEPTRVTITASGPLDYPQAMQSTSKSLLLVPGQDVTGDGVVLDLHGFIVEVLEPSDSIAVAGGTLSVRTRVRMLCGCPTQPGGMWDARDYTIQAQLVREGNVVSQSTLDYAGTSSEYSGFVSVPERPAPAAVSEADSAAAGGDGPPANGREEALTLRILVSDTSKANFGMAARTLTIRDSEPQAQRDPQEGRR